MNFFKNAMSHPKSTAMGFLIFLITTASVVSKWASGTLTGHTAATVASVCSLVGGLGAAYIGAIQQDAGKTLADVPGQPSPVMVSSHEIPDIPAAKVVLPEKP
jgi:hypothetical protein